MDELSKSLKESFKDPINIIFLIFLLCVFFNGIRLAGKNKTGSQRELMPSLAVSLGILGTFVGISIALLQFDVENLLESIKDLLGGMKTAFLTSVIGMMFSLILKYIYARYEDKYDRSSDEVLASLNDICSEIKLTRTETNEAFHHFAENFSQMASESMTDQLKSIVEKFNVNLNSLVDKSFQELREATIQLNMWQNQYKDEMKQNYKILSDIMGQISSQNKIINKSVQKIEKLSKVMEEIAGNLGKITCSGEVLAQQSKELAIQNSALQESIETVQQIGENSQNIIPELCKSVEELITGIKQVNNEESNFIKVTVDELKKNMNFVSESSKEQLKNIEQTLEKGVKHSLESYNAAFELLESKHSRMLEKIEEWQKLSNDFIADAGKQIGNNARQLSQISSESIEQIKNIIRSIVSASMEHFKENSHLLKIHEDAVLDGIEKMHNKTSLIMNNTVNDLKKGSESINALSRNQIECIEKSLQTALEKSLDSIAAVMLEVSGKFADDYTPLAEKLNKLVELTNSLELYKKQG